MDPDYAPFLDAIGESPDDLGLYGVFADFLQERGDTWGDLMRVQIQLERGGGADRRAWRRQEQRILADGLESRLLGELAALLREPSGYERRRHQWQFARGFLDHLQLQYPTPQLTKALAAAPAHRLLRSLELVDLPSGDDLADSLEQYADADWDYDSTPSLDELLPARFDNLRQFAVGGEYAYGSEIDLTLRNMPRLQSLALCVIGLDAEKVCATKMPSLRRLKLERFADQPLPQIARNASLQNLAELILIPHMLEPGDAPYLDLAGLRALCDSPHLGGVRKLSLTCTDFGDEGIDCLIRRGWLQRLEVLDLQYGSVTDAGALLLADQDLRGLRRLNLGGHYLTETGIDALRAKVPQLEAASQHQGEPDEELQHLWYGDME